MTALDSLVVKVDVLAYQVSLVPDMSVAVTDMRVIQVMGTLDGKVLVLLV